MYRYVPKIPAQSNLRTPFGPLYAHNRTNSQIEKPRTVSGPILRSYCHLHFFGWWMTHSDGVEGIAWTSGVCFEIWEKNSRKIPSFLIHSQCWEEDPISAKWSIGKSRTTRYASFHIQYSSPSLLFFVFPSLYIYVYNMRWNSG